MITEFKLKKWASRNPLAIAFGCLVGLGMLTIIVPLMLSETFDKRESRSMGKSEASALCTEYLGEFCKPIESHYVAGSYRDGWLVGGSWSMTFHVSGSERDSLLTSFSKLAGTEVVKGTGLTRFEDNGMYIMAVPAGVDRLRLTFTNQ